VRVVGQAVRSLVLAQLVRVVVLVMSALLSGGGPVPGVGDAGHRAASGSVAEAHGAQEPAQPRGAGPSGLAGEPEQDG
jgi:hypothetical protein